MAGVCMAGACMTVVTGLLTAAWVLPLGRTPRPYVPVRLSPSFFGLSPDNIPEPAADGRPEFVAVVTADIDADGDLDVVAASESLELFVWTNDGTGHLTRQTPHRSPGWQPMPGAPAVSPLDAGSTFFVGNDSPSFSHVLRAEGVGLEPFCWTTGVPAGRSHRSCHVTRSPRAPPALLPLA
jgi:hypothetical protein